MPVERVGVIGAGVIGKGVAQDLAQTGHEVVLVDVSDEILEDARDELTRAVRFHHLVASGAERQNTAEVMDTHSTMELLKRLDMKNIHATLPGNLELLRADGIDAWMKASEATHPTSDTPQSVDIILTSTHDLKQFIKFTWINAWGGMRGSIADAVMRKGRKAAAKGVADEIVRRLHPDQ